MTTDKSFENAWFSPFREAVTTYELTAYDALRNVKDYAYAAFDKLDGNGNGFIEQLELRRALKDPSTSEREKSFITFLLNNQQQIASSFDDGDTEHTEAISRKDLQVYFDMILNLLTGE